MSLSPKQRQALKRLINKNRSKITWFDTSFPQQLDFINDTSPLKAALCTRRAGKSFGVGEMVCKTACENPGVSIGVIGLTRDSIQKIYFKDIISVLNRKHGLGIEINKTQLSCTFPNGAVIYFAGADANEEEMNKFLGQKYKLVVIDEASMYKNIDLKKLVHDILEPAVADYRGQIVLIGTPSNFLNTYYHKVTEGKIPGWSVHKWTCYDNPHVSAQVKEYTDRMKRDNPKIEQDPGYRQHWLGEWVVDLGSRVYKFDEENNLIHPEVLAGYQCVLGVDLGYEDDTAFVVGAWSHYDKRLHIIHVEAKNHMILSDVENKIRHLQSLYPITTIVVDGASKQGVEELQNRFGMSFFRADKQGKKDFIELLNNDFLMNRLVVHDGKCDQLIKEWKALVWDDKKREQGRWEEDKSCSNHCTDAALYMWRWCYHYAAIPKTDPLTVEQEMERKLIEQMNNENVETIQYEYSDFE